MVGNQVYGNRLAEPENVISGHTSKDIPHKIKIFEYVVKPVLVATCIKQAACIKQVCILVCLI